MKVVPDSPVCDKCDSPATIHLRSTSTGTDHRYCAAHEPELTPGRSAELEIVRHRLPPLNSCSQAMSAPKNSPEHQMFREEMCETQLLGGEGACRYYLSRLTHSDQFALWSDEFLTNMREYVTMRTDGAATHFPFDFNTISCMVPFLEQEFEKENPDSERKQSKQDRAVVLLLQHPLWSDEQIAEKVPTTIKQLQRNTNYRALRSSVDRRNAMT